MDGVLRVYRTTPGGGATWPTQWTQIGAAGVPVYPGVTTVTIPWTGVPGPGHFCLLARWVSPTDPMTFEGPNISVNTQYNNNIAWRNVDSVRLTPGGPRVVRPFAIGNVTAAETKNAWSSPSRHEQARRCPGLRRPRPDPVRALASSRQGRQGSPPGRQDRAGDRGIGQASLGGLVLKPGERLEFSLTFSADTALAKETAFNVTQFGPDADGTARADLGGVRYLLAGEQRG